MPKPNIIYDNKNAINHSFLYFLHEENKFNEKSFSELYDYVIKLDSITVAELRDLYFIQSQVIRHIVLWSSFFVTLRPNFCYRVYATP